MTWLKDLLEDWQTEKSSKKLEDQLPERDLTSEFVKQVRQARMDYYKYQSPLVSKILDEIVSHMNAWKEDAKMGFGGVDCRHYIGLRLGKESDYLSDAILIDTNDRDEGLLFRKWGFESVDKKDKEMFVDALVQRLRQLAAEEFPLVQVGEASETKGYSEYLGMTYYEFAGFCDYQISFDFNGYAKPLRQV